jgi:hypothetical protein
MTIADAANPQLPTYRDLMLRYVPRWLRNGAIGKVMYTIGLHLDVLDDATNFGIQRRYPIDISEDAASLLGANRFIIRGEDEPWSSYQVRLRRWLIDHRVRGNPYPLLQQLNAYWGGAFPISLKYYGTNIRILDMDVGGNIARSIGNNVDPNFGVGNWLLIYYWPDPIDPPIEWDTPGETWDNGRIWDSGLTPATIQSLRRVPRQWGNAHTRGRIQLQYQGDPLNKIEFALGEPGDPTTPT